MNAKELRTMIFVAALLAPLVLAMQCAGKQLFGAEVHDAVVRIQNGNGIGSGCVIAKDENYLFCLTNAHVAGRQVGQSVRVEFWSKGYKSAPLTGIVVRAWYVDQYRRDIAIVAVERRMLGSVDPPAIPLARPGDVVDLRSFKTVGCPGGVWPNEVAGHAYAHDASAGDCVYFRPAPAPGRSGSPILSADGSKVVALIAWRNDEGDRDGTGEDGSYGIAMTHREIWAAIQGRGPGTGTMASADRPASLLSAEEAGLIPVPQLPAPEFHPTQQCGPFGCFPPRQPYGGQPYAPQGGGAWPNLPPDLAGGGAAPPASPGAVPTQYVTRDEMQRALDALEKKLDQQSGMVDEVVDDVGEVKSETSSLRAKLGTVAEQAAQSATVRQLVENFKADFLARLTAAETSEEGLIDRVTKALKGAAADQIADFKGQAEQKSSGSLLWAIAGLGGTLLLGQFGLGVWQIRAAKLAGAGVVKVVRRVRARRASSTTTEG